METQKSLKNRLFGLLILVFVGIAFWRTPPSVMAGRRRGVLGILADIGVSDSTTVYLVLYWIVGLALVIWGIYQLVTGRRLRLPIG